MPTPVRRAAKPAAKAPAAPPATGPRRRRRLDADARRRLILKAARKAFADNGDRSGTTIRTIAEKAGISEGLIYRHFDSKEQLYMEAVVEPLREVVDRMIETADIMNERAPVSPREALDAMRELNAELVGTLEEVLPLLGLVLFGDPKVARKFYRNNFAVAMDRMAEAWKGSQERYHLATDTADVSVRAVMGMCLVLALEDRYNPKFDRDRAITLVTEGVARGFFPPARAKRSSAG